MTEQWYTASSIPLEALIQAFQQVPGLQWVYAERPEETILVSLTDFQALAVSPEAWKHGRAFSSDAEIAWWKMAAGTQARIILSEESPPTLEAPWQPADALTPSPLIESVILVGQRDPQVSADQPAWRAARVPHLLHYPAQADWGRVALVIQPYMDANMLTTQRFVELQKGG